MELICVVPGLDQTIPDRVSCCLVGTLVVEIKSSAGQSVLNVVDDRALDGTLVAANI